MLLTFTPYPNLLATANSLSLSQELQRDEVELFDKRGMACSHSGPYIVTRESKLLYII